jgi:hypothetical protein
VFLLILFNIEGSLEREGSVSAYPNQSSEFILADVQGVPGGKVNILGGHSIGHFKKKLYMNMCPIPNGFRDRAI